MKCTIKNKAVLPFGGVCIFSKNVSVTTRRRKLQEKDKTFLYNLA